MWENHHQSLKTYDRFIMVKYDKLEKQIPQKWKMEAVNLRSNRYDKGLHMK